MRSRPRPALSKRAGRADYAVDARIQTAVLALRRHLRGESEAPDLTGLSDDELIYVHATALRDVTGELDQREFHRAMQRTAPVLAFPKVTDPFLDLWYMAMQEPVLTTLWGNWHLAKGRRGKQAAYTSSKALMMFQAALGASAHVKQSWMLFRQSPSIRDLFGHVELLSAAATGRTALDSELLGYDQCLRHISGCPETGTEGLVDTCYELSLQANIELIQQIGRFVDDRNFAKWAVIDGTDVAAWIAQVSRRDETLDAELRRRIPQAGARMVAYGSEGKTSLGAGTPLTAGASVKFWRGYYLVSLFEQRTGLPLVWTLQDAALDEARALADLLGLLERYWPGSPLEVVIGDSAWDEEWACRYCVERGIHPVFSRKPSLRAVDHRLTFFESESIERFTGEGRAFCRLHRSELQYSTAERATRRLRFTCPDGCGRLSLQMRLNHAALCYYPHHGHGRPDLFAMRSAWLARRNIAESGFSSLKVGNKVGLRGADRTRLIRFEAVRATISLAHVLKSAFVLADLRLQAGDMPTVPPPPLDRWLV